ncbi:MAG: maltose alpha-D-glucosyltransferase [Saprospirales bacterium]|nr:maltose alpha-D-glucosyltransferase [Saprospirales bacterium]
MPSSASQWYKDAVIYELPIKSFYDSNGDGIGDFKGAMQKLDYLERLGVNALWVLPFFPSPLRDDGYDVADYYSVNPIYGNLDDFKAFVAEAHRRNMRVIIELVINHTSDQHAWFQRAKKAPEGSSHRNFYVWSPTNDKYQGVRIIFQDYESSNWSWDPEVGQYYWHRFFHHQPDLNFDNPEVQQEIFEVLDYWAQFGVDGFRLDAIPYLFEREGTSCENVPETHEFLKKVRKHVDEKYKGEVLFLAEANMWPEDAAAYFGNDDECHMNFHFPLMPRLYMALRRHNRDDIVNILARTPEIPENCQWATFLRNHDELTLEMVTDINRQYMWEEYSPDPRARINLGIRRRLACLMEGSRRKTELMNVLLFSMPGTPVLYYGDEIGMGDNYHLDDRNGVRTPMQWNSGLNAGFSTANPQEIYLPVIIDPEFHYESVNVEVKENKPRSILKWTQKIISLYKQHKAFARGSMAMLEPANHSILAYIRSYRDEHILSVVNLSDKPEVVELDLASYAGWSTTELFGGNAFPGIADKAYLLTIGGFGYFWLKLTPP